MRILLINPPFQRLNKVQNSYFPLGLGYIAAVLDNDRHFVRIYNADKGKEDGDFSYINLNKDRIASHDNYLRALRDKGHYVWKEVLDTIEEFRPDVVGIQAMTSTFPSAVIVASICKSFNRKLPVIMGGIHPTISPQKVLDNADTDFIVIGEGELVVAQLMYSLEKGQPRFADIKGIGYKESGKQYINGKREYVGNLDDLPLPARGLVLNPRLYTYEMASIISARGCPFNCTFCNAQSIWSRNVRYRSPENFIQEIEIIKSRYGGGVIAVQDDTFTVNKDRITKICNMLIKNRLNIKFRCNSRADIVDPAYLSLLKKAGCVNISLGVETGSPRLLKLIDKCISVEQIINSARLIKQAGIEFDTTFLIGTPDEKEEDIICSIELLKKIKPNFTNICTYTPYPGSAMYERTKELGLIRDDLDWSRYSHHSYHNTFVSSIPKERFEQLRNELIETADRYNSEINPATLAKKIANNWKLLAKNPRIIRQKLRQAKAVLGNRFVQKKANDETRT